MDVTAVIPAYNEEQRLPKCLSSLYRQRLSYGDLRVIVVDDGSTDRTVHIARSYGAQVLYNGTHDIEIGKSIGLAHVETELVLFLDADNWQPDRTWLETAVQALITHPQAAGAQSCRFAYVPSDPPANRYCSLIGAADPVAYYLGKRDRLMHSEARWSLPGLVVEANNQYCVIQFDEHSLPTVGSQGFLTRTSLIRSTNWQPRLYHLESNLALVRAGYCQYIMLWSPVGHDHCRSSLELLRKLDRNARLFLQHSHERTYRYDLSLLRAASIMLIMTTGIRPAYDALRGFLHKPDVAWFLHVPYCLAVPWMYAIRTILHISDPRKLKVTI